MTISKRIDQMSKIADLISLNERYLAGRKEDLTRLSNLHYLLPNLRKSCLEQIEKRKEIRSRLNRYLSYKCDQLSEVVKSNIVASNPVVHYIGEATLTTPTVVTIYPAVIQEVVIGGIHVTEDDLDGVVL